MKSHNPLLRLLVSALGGILLTACSAAADEPSGPVQVFILAGQSNMEGQAVSDLTGKDYNGGRGTLRALLADPVLAPRLQHLTAKNGGWSVRADDWCRYQRERGPLLAGPLSMGFSVYGDSHHFGPELQLGHRLGDKIAAPVLLIKTAWGGKSLFQDFRPPSAGGKVGPYYTRLIAEVKTALKNMPTDFPALGEKYRLAGFVWYQGWNDGVNPQTAVPEYAANLAHLIRDVRKDLAAPQLPVVIGELTGPWVDAPPEWERLRSAQKAVAQLPEFQGNTVFVPTRDFVRKPEDSPNPTHGHHEFGNAETYFLVGDALARGMLSLLERPAEEPGAPAVPALKTPQEAAAPQSAFPTLEENLRSLPAAELAAMAQREGDPLRGAVVFFQHHMACSKCHSVGAEKPSSLGPDLATIDKQTTGAALVEAVLSPSQVIRKGYETLSVATVDGKIWTGLLVERTAEKVVLRDASRAGEVVTIPAAEIDELKTSPLSLMPTGQVNQLASRQQFLDLIRYLIDIRDGGPARARELQPSPALLTFKLPEYEQRIDHAGFIRDWNAAALKRGEAIYQRVCSNCHGTKDRPGSLPNSLRFAEGKFKNGSDPLAMYRTITSGFGLMAPQTWMAPSQKYDVIHYIRETYLRPHNPSQFVAADSDYLARLPKGDTRGPAPSKIEPWSAMDYGPSLTHTYEIPGGKPNFAYKGIAVRLDPGAGGVSRGRHWMAFDTDTLRMAAAWSAQDKDENFINWRGIQFNGEHQIHPQIVGRIAYANPIGPGWGSPAAGSFRDDQRVLGRDGRWYGPLPRDWGKFRGLYHHGQQVVLSYTIGGAEILELPGLSAEAPQEPPLFVRTFNIGPRERDLVLQVAEHPAEAKTLRLQVDAAAHSVRFGPLAAAQSEPETTAERPFAFDGGSYLEIPAGDQFDLTTHDFTIAARIKTTEGGTIFALAQPGPKWTPDGQALFVRGGQLVFDIGWVGAVVGKTKVNDGRWHDVAAAWRKSDSRLQLFVDGKLSGEGSLAAKAELPKRVARIGFASPNFPQPKSYFAGELSEVRFYQRLLPGGVTDWDVAKPDDALLGRWTPPTTKGEQALDQAGGKRHAVVRRGEIQPDPARQQPLVAGVVPSPTGIRWQTEGAALRLHIPAGKEPVRFSLWVAGEASTSPAKTPAAMRVPPVIADADRDLAPLTRGGPPRWPQLLETRAAISPDNGPLAVDLLTEPQTNPWLAQMRFTGLDFLPNGAIAACTWDGDVWLIENQPSTAVLRWRRIASGMFQPLGLKVVDGVIHLTCRDQLVVLRDLNGDGEIDFYECLNNDAQVTEHFHEFAMGLQTDAEGNFYYAKSGRHALPAVVPHHGVLLRVARDGSRTEILANGFRAANGVCLNPDGSFLVTDQEGFWNPKNRINWVTVDPASKPKFYGNLFGYTDVTDPSDAAMEPPLCWITNSFDRSPAELLWVDSPRWGALNGSLLSLSYGYGKVFLVPHERAGGKEGGVMQGGLIELPMPPLPTGAMRGRFNPADGQLYLCGMFAWGGSAAYPGGLYRVRATGLPYHMPTGLQATKAGLKLTFTDPLDEKTLDPKQFEIKTWSLKRSAGYGSKHYDEKPLVVRSLALADDRKTLTVELEGLQPTWCMEIKYTLQTASGKPVSGVIHNTIHALK